ncbi:hypothetical protein K439DRAFT_947456 [Ramaria rubella]|nr:hypothetical protein K439DRAFT_947456 [Ramaria rubella]
MARPRRTQAQQGAGQSPPPSHLTLARTVALLHNARSKRSPSLTNVHTPGSSASASSFAPSPSALSPLTSTSTSSLLTCDAPHGLVDITSPTRTNGCCVNAECGFFILDFDIFVYTPSSTSTSTHPSQRSTLHYLPPFAHNAAPRPHRSVLALSSTVHRPTHPSTMHHPMTQLTSAPFSLFIPFISTPTPCVTSMLFDALYYQHALPTAGPPL